jgi:D-alanyl-D-alanine carboxypeptidase
MKYYVWLVQNAHLYGWHNTYQKWVAIDGYEVEPWHWRYLWEELATYLYENKITIAEYYNNRIGSWELNNFNQVEKIDEDLNSKG